MTGKKVLLVESHTEDSSIIGRAFTRAGHRITVTDDAASALERVLNEHYDLVITEMSLPKGNGLELLQRIKEANEGLPVIILSADAGVREAVEAMKLGASDFMVKPLTAGMMKAVISYFSNGASSGKRGDLPAVSKNSIITRNNKMTRLLEEARDIADSQASVLIQGESGTGKELFARYIHRNSNRKNGPLVAINCAALPETLLESELFGHEKGSFTGAIGRKKGKFEMAHSGTILLDEVSEMNIQLQSKLLRVLQEREIDRVGGTALIPVDIRVIATTNRDIQKEVDEGKFREDLFYRLNVIPFHLPPLRERKEDIPILAEYFVEKYNRIDGRSVKGLTKEAKQTLVGLPWKGNVRELENVIERAVLRCKGDWIGERDLGLNMETVCKMHLTPPSASLSLREMERKMIFQALDRTNGNRTYAAEILGISVRTLRNKLNEYRKKMEQDQERHANCF